MAEVRLTIRLEPVTHKALRQLCLDHRTTLQKFMTLLVERALTTPEPLERASVTALPVRPRPVEAVPRPEARPAPAAPVEKRAVAEPLPWATPEDAKVGAVFDDCFRIPPDWVDGADEVRADFCARGGEDGTGHYWFPPPQEVAAAE